jgi:hypothetical protein
MSNEPRPRVAMPGAVKVLRWVLIGLLAAAAAAALLGLPRAFQGGWPSSTRLIPVVLLVLFVGGYAAYRFVLVRAGRYSEGKALVRVGLMALLIGVIASIALERPPAEPVGPGLDLAAPLASPDPALRTLAAEVVRGRPAQEARRHAGRLLDLLEDADPAVRREARASLGALTGADGGEGPGAAARWRELCASRGLIPAR